MGKLSSRAQGVNELTHELRVSIGEYTLTVVLEPCNQVVIRSETRDDSEETRPAPSAKQNP